MITDADQTDAELLDPSTERGARAVLSHLVEAGDHTLSALLEADPAPEVLARVLSDSSPEFGAARLRAARVDTRASAAYAIRQGISVLVPGDAQWPEGLTDVAEAPICLWVDGPLELSRLRWSGVSIVGSRAATAYGRDIAAGLAAGLSERGYAVVSGAAFGIDAAAHRGALVAGRGGTVAVLAGGVDRPYPSAHGPLLAELRERGAVLSESPPGWAPQRHRFLLRNRIIAAMTAGTVVVEAGLRSGSLNTARHAATIGRPVGVVPGPVTSMLSAGCHQAVRDGVAMLVTDVAEVLDLVGRMGQDAAARPSAPAAPQDLLSAADQVVWAALPIRAATSVDALVFATGVAPGALMAALTRLELAGLAARVGADWRRRVP
ncbi:MAG: DNA-protecting protein DprA [Actinomycetales bacterium]|nr:DNA-protecting protein DprA [Actinomycetales bacterium]